MAETKYEILYKELKQLIVGMRAGEKFLTSRAIMSQFKVSQLVVDKAKTMLSKEGLITSEHGKGTFVAPDVVKHKKKGCERIAFALSNWPDPFIRDISDYVMTNYQNEDGVYVELVYFDWRKGICTDLPSGAEGLVILPTQQKISPEQLIALNNLEVPYITWSHIFQDVSKENIYSDPIEGPILASQHLINLGHRKIAALEAEPQSGEQSRRIEAFASYAKLHGATVDIIDCGTISGESSMIKAYEKIQELVQSDKLDYTAIFVVNDTSAMGVLNALANHNINVPQQISVMGYGGFKDGAYYHPGLTTIDTKPLEQFDYILGQMLDRTRGNNDTSKSKAIHPELILRGSTAELK